MADAEDSVPVTVRRMDGEVQVVSVNPEMPLEELRATLGAGGPEDHVIKLFLNLVELRSGSCADAGIVDGSELTSVTLRRPVEKINEVTIWAMVQRCRFDIDFRYRLEVALQDGGHDVDIDDFRDIQDDNRCIDALGYLSDLNLEDEDWQTLLHHLDGLTSNGGRDDDDNWAVEIAMATCMGKCGAPKIIATKLLTLCARSLDSWEEFTAMALVISIWEVCRRDQGALPPECMAPLLECLVQQDWIAQGDDGDGDGELARRAVVAVCHLAAEFGDAATLEVLQEGVAHAAAKELLA